VLSGKRFTAQQARREDLTRSSGSHQQGSQGHLARAVCQLPRAPLWGKAMAFGKKDGRRLCRCSVISGYSPGDLQPVRAWHPGDSRSAATRQTVTETLLHSCGLGHPVPPWSERTRSPGCPGRTLTSPSARRLLAMLGSHYGLL